MDRQNPVIVLTGAGSGGHITPLLAVADEIKAKSPNTHLIYIGQKGDKLGDIPANHASINEVHTVRAGKFRRYHGEGLKQLLDVSTFLLNCRDAIYVLIGLVQSWVLLRKIRPDVIFIKGGFVGVPVGVAAAKLKIPYVTHDSDAIPGLANRIISKKAAMHAVAMPKETYSYDQDKTVTTGIPLQKNFERVTPELTKVYRSEAGVPEDAKMLFIIGGGLGSQRINDAVIKAAPNLLGNFPNLYIVHAVGRANHEDVNYKYEQQLTAEYMSRVNVYGYLNDVYRYSGAADLVITRAGATNLAEFAVQGRACLVVPSPFLTGGHQLKNAKLLEERGAIEVLPEDELLNNPTILINKVSELLNDDHKRQMLGATFNSMSIGDGAARIAELLLDKFCRRT